MGTPGFLHVTGRAMWARCDHHATRIEGSPARITLAPAQEVAGEAGEAALPAWRAAMGSAARIACPPDLCEGAALLLADPARGLFALREGGWATLPLPAQHAPTPGALDFAPPAPPPAATPPRALAVGPLGRPWLLDTPPGGQAALRLLGPDFRLAARLPLPQGAAPHALACARWGVVVADGAEPRLFFQPWGGEWRGVALPGAPLSLAADPRFSTVVAVLEGQRLAVMRGPEAPAIHPLPAVARPLHALLTAEDRVLIADVAGTPGAPLPTRITEFHLTSLGPEAEAGFALRGFDGRALWLDEEGHAFGSTATGARRLYAREARLRTNGMVETFALDSGVFACVWHRIFLDACVPPGTAVAIEARTSDTLPPEGLRRVPNPPADLGAPLPEEPAWPPLGSLEPEEPVGWSPVGLLDRRPAYADQPLPPFAAALPSEDSLRSARGHAEPPPEAMVTLEGLVKAPPGRWLWLRLRLTGTERRAPSLFALRATRPRPSLMDMLPAYWRGDPVAADASDRALALFEGFVTETDARITALRHLLGAGTAPAEALDWLASFLALTFDARIGEPVRRSLLAEAATLWRQRGTVRGLTRLLSILAEAPVQIVEGFRLRRESTAVLGAPDWGVLGPGLQLGDEEEGEPSEPWEEALARRHAALLLRRAATRAEGGTPCPDPEPPDPLAGDALIRFHRRFAHRFTVIVPATRTETLEAVLDLATETNKPAHTLHSFCWLDAGFRLGAGSLVGLAPLGCRPGFRPGLLGTAPLGVDRTIGRAAPEGRMRLDTPLTHSRTRPP